MIWWCWQVCENGAVMPAIAHGHWAGTNKPQCLSWWGCGGPPHAPHCRGKVVYYCFLIQMACACGQCWPLCSRCGSTCSLHDAILNYGLSRHGQTPPTHVDFKRGAWKACWAPKWFGKPALWPMRPILLQFVGLGCHHAPFWNHVGHGALGHIVRMSYADTRIAYDYRTDRAKKCRTLFVRKLYAVLTQNISLLGTQKSH